MKYFENILFCDFGRFWSSCCLSLGHVARGFSAFLTPCGICFAERYRVPLELFISFRSAICSKTNSKSQEINL